MLLVEDVFQDWTIVGLSLSLSHIPADILQDQWLQDIVNDAVSAWHLGNLLLTGYTCILFMLRKANLPETSERRTPSLDNDDMIPRSDLSMRAARRILQVLCHMADSGVPAPELLSCTLGVQRLHVPIAHFARGLMEVGVGPGARDDVLLFGRAIQCVEDACERAVDFVPLLRTLRTINVEIEKQVALRSEGTS